ncbi:MAG: hypothetical protein WDO73_07110 [Ignavibacteriota bacterium]
MSGVIAIAWLAALVAQKPFVGVKTFHPTSTRLQAANFTLAVTPPTISFGATNPGTNPVVAGSASANITWNVVSGGNNWSLKVQASAPTLTNCPSVPVSAIKVSCSAASVGSLGGTANCAASFPLSTTAAQVAGGAEGTFSYSYSVTVSFTLADSWKYVAETTPACSISLTYTANIP